MKESFRKVNYRASKEFYYSIGAFLFSAHYHGDLLEKYETTFLAGIGGSRK